MMVRAVAAATVVFAAVGAGSASAKDRVYWTNRAAMGAPSIAWANLDGSGGANLTTTGAAVNAPFGTTLDPAGGRIYWPNRNGNTISFANLDGTGHGGSLNITGATITQPIGIAFEPTTRRVYWANATTPVGSIAYASVDGAGGGNLGTTTATLNNPFGVAVDPVAGRLYWSNAGTGANKISFANLDGSGGGDLNTTGATVSNATGVAVDPVGRRIYWANWDANKISYANLNGTGGGDLNTTGALVSGPEGVAVDRDANRIYWGNSGGSLSGPMGISYANLDGTGNGHTLTTTGASLNWSVFPSILKVPAGTAAPAASGGSTVGSSLSCTTGSWAADVVPAFLYRAPHAFSYQWTVNGAAVAGATGSTVVTNAAGDWRCVVTAANAAGSTSQTSNAVTVFGDTDHDGILDPNDKCPTTPRGQFDKNNDGCPGPYSALRLSTLGTWSVFPKGVQIGSMTVKGLHKGVKVKLSCRACHVSQTLTAKGSTLSLKKLKRKLIRRGKSFTLTATALGFIGDQLTLTVKRYGRKHADLVRAARNPFTKKHRCLPVGSSKTAKTCSATPPTGP